jgi:hypothetical protein
MAMESTERSWISKVRLKRTNKMLKKCLVKLTGISSPTRIKVVKFFAGEIKSFTVTAIDVRDIGHSNYSISALDRKTLTNPSLKLKS